MVESHSFRGTTAEWLKCIFVIYYVFCVTFVEIFAKLFLCIKENILVSFK